MQLDVLEVLQKLPQFCGARLPSDNSPIMIKRGVMGYWQWQIQGMTPERYNERHGITDIQVECMMTGSMVGWDVPGADVDFMTAQAETLRRRKEGGDVPRP
jgi:hypothetical protein